MKHEQIITLWNAEKSAAWIAEHLGIHRETVSVHLKSEGIIIPQGRPPGGGRKPTFISEVPTDPQSSDQNRHLSGSRCPASTERVEVPITPSACEPHRDFIEDRVIRGQNAQVIWQDMVDELGFQSSYDSVKRFVRKLKQKVPEVFAVISTEPGYEAQVDYGRGAPTIHPETGKLRRPRLFSMKMSHSRKTFRKVVWKSSSRIWCELHEEAFRYFGGVPKTIRLDNLKEGVIKPDIYDPELNPLYAAMLTHYGSCALPCRVATPRHKGKVESDIKYTQNTLKGRTFESIEAQQMFLDHWSTRWADTRIHGTIKRQVKEIFETEEKLALGALPPESFPILQIVRRKVHSDGHIKVDNAYYSAPSSWVHKEVTVNVGRCFVDIFNPSTGERLARHFVASKGRYQTNREHLPDSKRVDNLHGRLIRKARAVGPNMEKVVGEILRQQPYHAIRSAQGVISLTRKYQGEIVEAAARLCSERGIYTYRGIKKVVEHEASPPKPSRPTLTQDHPLIRKSASYQELWKTHTDVQ